MKMIGSKLVGSIILFSAAFQAVSATTVTAPEAGAVWESNTQQKIRWSNPSESKVDVRLVKGAAENLQFVQYLCQDVDGSSGECTTTVPFVKSDINYAVTVGKDANKYGYSSYFDIKGDGPMPERKGCPKMGGQNCPQNLPCCSASGYCGDSDAHCGSGCMPQYSFNGACTKPGSSPQPDPQPNPPAGDGKCGQATCTSNNPCCSAYDYCGNSDDHCGKGCQPSKSFSGKCAKPTANPPKSDPPKSNPPKTGKGNAKGNPPKGKSPAQRKCGRSTCSKTSPCCDRLTNKCTNTWAGCRDCIAKSSFKGKCVRHNF